MGLNFSQRMGLSSARTTMQIGGIDNDLRNSLWNAFSAQHPYLFRTSFMRDSGPANFAFTSIWGEFLKIPVDTLNHLVCENGRALRNWFFKAEWFQVFDFLEFMVAATSDSNEVKSYNKVLERELSAYRFVQYKVIQLTSQSEIDAIESAVGTAESAGFLGAQSHIVRATELAFDRKAPDFRNAIKEAISAVESAASQIAKSPKAELGQALKVLEDQGFIHSALKRGFLAIYGYTSDEGGIRHAMIEEASVDSDDAKYMVISCAAFISYLLGKQSKILT